MERASSDEPAWSSEEAKNLILEVAKNRPGTHVAKCILAYDERPDLPSLIALLEEVSKNTDYSTDLRISLQYYGEEFLRHGLVDGTVPRRLALVAAGSAVQYCGKIYGDRVEYNYQAVEHQIEALLTSQKEPAGESNGPDNAAPRPEEPRKRRAKKLTKKEVDPYMLTMEPRRFKTMSDEKRFSTTGFVKCTKNRTIEYLYQDHMLPNLWRHAPIVDPQNPLDLDEKKQYKMFTYHVEHRYNTLLPDIPFERLHLIKEYLHTNQMNTLDILNEDMTTKDYLDQYIALENKMLASRYGATVRTNSRLNNLGKRLPDESAATSVSKRARLEEDQAEAGLTAAMEMDQSMQDDLEQSPVAGQILCVDSGIDEPMDSTPGCVSQEMDFSLSVRQVADTSLSVSQLPDSAIGISLEEVSSQVENYSLSVSQEENCSLSVSQVDNPPLSSTLALNESSTLAINESSILESTRLDYPPVTEEELLQIDFGIGMDDVSDSHHTGQSFEDEGVVLSDLEDQHRRQSGTGVVNNDNDLSEIKVETIPPEELAPIDVMHAEEPVNVPREVCYPLVLNIFGFPNKHVRRKLLFKLPKEFDSFMNARNPSKRVTQRKPQAVSRRVDKLIQTDATDDMDEMPDPPHSLEFDSEQNFLGFRRRATMDSGYDFDEHRYLSRTISPEVEASGNAHIEPVSGEPVALDSGNSGDENSPRVAPDSGISGDENSPREAPNPEAVRGTASDEALVSEMATSCLADRISADLNVTTEEANTADIREENSGMESLLEVTQNTEMDSGLGTTFGNQTTIIDDVTADSINPDDETRSDTPMEINDKDDFTDCSTIIRDWHMRLAPTLEAAHARQNFNIHDLGTEILNVCQSGDNDMATLADVMADKDPSIMCRYMLASLVLTNHGNVSLHFGNRDKNKPIDMSQFCMKLESMERMEIHPEDDVGNMSAQVAAKAKSTPARVNGKRMSTEMASSEVFSKTIRLIQPVPKISQSAYDTDSGISSMCSSMTSATQGD